MRVIAGVHRSRPLATFRGDEIRPTADRVKESLFNILRNKVVGRRYLDLFAGTGGIGIEAISRGAAEVVFVDQRRESVALVKKNLALLKEEAEVVLSDAIAYLRRAEPFDVIFIDPPYAGALGEAALRVIAENALLTEDGSPFLNTRSRLRGRSPGCGRRTSGSTAACISVFSGGRAYEKLRVRRHVRPRHRRPL